MPLYLCRWPNGDFSFVWAANREAAVETLDEVDNAEGCPVSVVREFMLHFRLGDDGTFEFEGFGEATGDAIWRAYPILDQAVDEIHEGDPSFELHGRSTREQQQVIKDAVRRERARVQPQRVKQPQTQLGRDIKSAMDAPTSIIDREIRKRAGETLKKFKPEGKPN